MDADPAPESAPLDWSEADARRDAMLARLRAEPAIAVGDGLGLNGRTIENLGKPGGGASDSLAKPLELYVVINGTVYLAKFGNVFLGEEIT